MGIFDELVTGLSKEITKVQSRSQEMVKSYALNSQIRTLERRKSGILTELGRMVFDKYERKLEITDENFKSRTEEIADIDDEIADLQDELEALQLANDPTASASQKSQAKAGYHPTSGFTCPKCEAPANQDKPFCPSCGCSLAEGKEKRHHHDDELCDEEH
ncbi:MAG: hypothetical protein K2Y22_08320 [Candidatus Obscuribacterales bacterium]|nr:hypothetical protein [Candidatus Obscuribacterales bacterium]